MYVIEEKVKEKSRKFVLWAACWNGMPIVHITYDIAEARQFDTMVEAYNYIKKNKIKAKDFKVVSTRWLQ